MPSSVTTRVDMVPGTSTPGAAVIDLYAMGSPNVVKIYIALEETGFPYIVPVDVFGEEQFKPQFPKFSPNAKCR